MKNNNWKKNKPLVNVTAKIKNTFLLIPFRYRIYMGLMAGTFLLYGWTFSYSWCLDDGFFLDIIQKADNNWEGFKTLLSQRIGHDYRPVTNIVFWLERKVTGELNPSISHLLNTFLFGLIIIQIFRFMLNGSFLQDTKTLTIFAFITTIIFMIHPMHVSVVANVKSRDNLLSMLFGITAAIQAVRYLNDYRPWRIALFLILYFLAEMSKSDAYAFAFLPLLYHFIYRMKPAENQRKWFSWITPIVIFLGILIVYNLFKNTLVNQYLEGTITSREFVDSPLVLDDSFINRLSLSFTTMLYYLKFFVLPFGHYVYFGFDQIPLTSLFSPLNILSFLLYAFLFVFSILKYKTQKIYTFAFLFYLGAIFYASNLPVVVSGILADRYNFIGSLGLCMFAAIFFVEIIKKNNWKINIAGYTLIVLLVVFTGFTIYRTTAWKDTETLFLRDLPHVNRSAHSYYMLSSVYINSALFDQLSPDESQYKMANGEDLVNAGLEICDWNPFLLENKGITWIYYGENDKSLYYFRKAFDLDSNLLSVANHMGMSFRNLGNIDSAMYYFEYAMNRENQFFYSAENYVDMLLHKERYKSVDSTLRVLSNRFPNDNYLKMKIANYYQNGKWFFE